MPDSKPDAQHSQVNGVSHAQPSAAEQAHLQSLESVVSFFEKQDPDGFFRVPVTEEVAPNYFSVIKHPMCFHIMRHKLHARDYRTFSAFTEDFELVCNNAMKYNQKRSRVHRSAVNLLRHGKKHLNNVQLEATRAIHMLHPEGPTVAAQEESAVNRAASSPAVTASNAQKQLPALDAPALSKQLSKIPSGLDAAVAPAPLLDLQMDYFSDDDPAYSSFSDTDVEEDPPHQHSMSVCALHQRHPSAQSEHWPSAPAPAQTIKAEPGQSQQQPRSSAWKAQWLQLRIHALQQQQQVYEVRLQQLRMQELSSGATVHPPDFWQPHAQAPSSAAQPAIAAGTSASAAPSQSAHKRAKPDSQAEEPQRKLRRIRWPVPGLSVAELADHPFFGHANSHATTSSSAQPVLQVDELDDNYPARVHATLELLDRHLLNMKEQLMPKPIPGRAPPKKVARGGVAVNRRGKAKPGRSRGLFSAPSKQVLDRSDSRLGSKRRRTTDYDFGDVIMPPMPGAKALTQLPKVCISVPGVRPLAEEELDRRARAVELVRSGTSLSEADADLRDLVHMPSAGAVAEPGVSSSDEDSSDEAFAARHAVLEAEERAKFNSYAGTGGGAQRSRNTGSKSKPPKPPSRLESLPSEIKHLDVAPAAIPPQSVVAVNTAAMLSPAPIHISNPPTAVSTALPATSPIISSMTQQAAPIARPSALTGTTQVSRIPDGEDNAGSDCENVAKAVPNGALELKSGQQQTAVNISATGSVQDDSLTKLPQLGLTLSSTKTLASVPSRTSSTPKIATPKSARVGTPRGSRAPKGRPPRSSSNLGRQDSTFTADTSDERTLLRHSTG